MPTNLNSTTTKTTPGPNYWLGFDTAKAKMDYSLIDAQGLEMDYGTVPNNPTELTQLLLTITGNYPGEAMHCVVEATSTYHYGLLEACQAVGIQCIVYNAF